MKIKMASPFYSYLSLPLQVGRDMEREKNKLLEKNRKKYFIRKNRFLNQNGVSLRVSPYLTHPNRSLPLSLCLQPSEY